MDASEDVVAGFSPRSTPWKQTRAKARDYILRRSSQSFIGCMTPPTVGLLRAAFQSGRDHLNLPDAAATGNIQGVFFGTTEGKALAVLIVARHLDGAETLTLRSEDLNAGSRQRIKPAFTIDDDTVGAGYDPRPV